MYHSLKGQYGWVLHYGDVFEFTNIGQCPHLEEISTLYISDSIPPKSVNTMTVLITSPQRVKWKEFFKEPGSRMLHFLMYSYSEMCALRSECFFHMDVKTKDERYAVWGGNPRSLLTMSHVSIAKGSLRARFAALITVASLAQYAMSMGMFRRNRYRIE